MIDKDSHINFTERQFQHIGDVANPLPYIPPLVRPPSPPASKLQIGGDHYKNLPIQPIEYIVKNGLGWLEGNAIKYITRHKQKGEKSDIEKAIHYLQILLEGYNEIKKF